MRTVYSNTDHPEFVKWSCILAAILGLLCIVQYFILINKTDSDKTNILECFSFFFLLTYSALIFGSYYLNQYTVDTDADTLTNGQQKKYPLRISKLKTITYKESKKGKFRSLFVHDDGVGFMDIRTTKQNADLIAAQLLEANPSIEIRHANYI